MKVNEKIRFLREQNNWSQEEMANKLHMSKNGYSKIERGETRLTIPKLEQISEIFDIDVLELMSLGEKNILLFQEKNNVSFISSSYELSAEIRHLKTIIEHKDEIILSKDEIIAQKDNIIEAQKREIALLKK